jgi:hypothetical protein
MKVTKNDGTEVLKNASAPQIESYLLSLIQTNKMNPDVLDGYQIHDTAIYPARAWYLERQSL